MWAALGPAPNPTTDDLLSSLCVPGADINAVRPMYQRRLSTFVKEMPQLWRFSWQVGTRVKWVWTFTRKYEKDGKVKIFCEDEADVPYGKTIIGRKVEGSALMACEGLGGFD